MATYLVTGAAGFIGSHLLERLKKDGHKVIGIDNYFHSCRDAEWCLKNNIQWADVRSDIDDFVRPVDAVFHLAAQIHVDRSILNPKETVDININGTINVLDAVTKYKKKMVFASSSEIYGSSQDRLMDEKHQLDAQSPYAASKVAGDRMCKAYFDTYGTKVAILRNFNTFGPYQADDSYGGVIAIFTRRALTGQDIEIFGDGKQSRDYMWVDDAVSGYLLCLKKQLWGQTINIGSGIPVTINEIAETIQDITKTISKIKHIDPRPGEVQRLCANTSKANQLGFKSKTNFNTNLREYAKWFKDTVLPTIC
jgi:UDP-glucose 4-epimerase